MKKILGFLLATTLMGSAYAQSGSLALNSAFPDQSFSLSEVRSGAQVARLSDLKTDKGLLVIFTCNTCPFVIKNIERTKEILTQAKANGIGVLLVNSNEAQRAEADAPDKMAEFAGKQNYPNYFIDKDAQLADAFGASHTPEVFLFDGKTERLVYKGAMDDSPSDPTAAKTIYLKDAMNNLVAGKTISPAETKSVGCSIKRVKK